MSAISRLPGWPELLAAFIDARRHMPFAWGSNDCALFAADAVREMTGVDFAADHRSHDSADSAARALAAVGGLHELAAACLPEREAVGLAQRGDVVMVPIDGRDTLGIVVGNGCWCAPGESGLVFRPMSEVPAAFAV